jgi:beta-glucanase (GH16 family)
MRSRRSKTTPLIAALSLACASIASGQSIPTTTGQQWVSTWSDEFNNGNADLTGWSYDLGGGGWGNNEKEVYTNSTQNVSVSTTAGVGALHIDAIATGTGANQTYTSGRIKTQNLFSQAYGLFEFRAKLPSGTGLWPALWMMPKDSAYGGWPTSGEIDVLESRGDMMGLVQGTHHSGTDPGHLNSQTRKFSDTGLEPPGFTTADWHTYDLAWIPGSTNKAGSLKWYVDGVLYSTKSGDWTIPSSGVPAGDKDAPFGKPFYVIINLAVGGNYVGNAVNLAPGTYGMQVDYVRAYRSLFAGDANQNGIINSSDFAALASHYNNTGATWKQGDFNSDGIVNALDFNILAANFGKQSLPSWAIPGSTLGSLVPEPATLMLASLLSLALRRHRRLS